MVVRFGHGCANDSGVVYPGVLTTMVTESMELLAERLLPLQGDTYRLADLFICSTSPVYPGDSVRIVVRNAIRLVNADDLDEALGCSEGAIPLTLSRNISTGTVSFIHK